MVQSRKIIANASWLMLNKLVRVAFGLTVGIWMARHLGPEYFGVLSYALAFCWMFSLFVDLGLSQILVRNFSRRNRFSGKYLGTAFALKFAGAIVGIALTILTASMLDVEAHKWAVITIIACRFLMQPFDVIDDFFQATFQGKKIAIARMTALFLCNVFIVCLILADADLTWFAVALMFETILAGIGLALLFRYSSAADRVWRPSLRIAKVLMKDAWPLALSVLLMSIHARLDQVMIGNMLDNADVGIYAAAVRLSEFWLFVPGVIVAGLMPWFSRKQKSSPDQYRNGLLSLYSLMLWMGVLVGVIMMLIGQEVVLFLFGEQYQGTYEPLVINIWIGLFISQAHARGIWLINENLQRFRLYNNLILVVLNMTLNFLLIPKYGATGAAMATLITQMTGTWGLGLVWKPLRQSTIDLILSANPAFLLKWKRVRHE